MFQPYCHPQVHFHFHCTYKNNFSVHHLLCPIQATNYIKDIRVIKLDMVM
jgi:hypothetical protein